MTTIVLEYITADNGTVHLMADPFGGDAKTLCGRRAFGWTMGDETVSGLSATCLRCVQLNPITKEKGVNDRRLLMDMIADESFNLLKAEARRTIAERALSGDDVLEARDRGRRRYEASERSAGRAETRPCRFCGNPITHGGTPALDAAPQWFGSDDDFSCPDGEQEHEPMPDPTDFMDDEEIAAHNEAMNDPDYREAMLQERN